MAMNRSIDIEEVLRDLPSLLDEVEAGAQFIVTRDGRPVALLTPMKIPLGFANFDLPESFFEPLPTEEFEAWEQDEIS